MLRGFLLASKVSKQRSRETTLQGDEHAKVTFVFRRWKAITAAAINRQIEPAARWRECWVVVASSQAVEPAGQTSAYASRAVALRWVRYWRFAELQGPFPSFSAAQEVIQRLGRCQFNWIGGEC